MSEHLQSQSVSRCVLGEATEADRAHLANCAQCRVEVDEFEQALHGLRGSVRHWSSQEFAALSQTRFMPSSRPLVSAAWSMALILLFSIVGVRSFVRPAPPPAIAFVDSDAELMDEVRADMDRTVPRGMESLQALP